MGTMTPTSHICELTRTVVAVFLAVSDDSFFISLSLRMGPFEVIGCLVGTGAGGCSLVEARSSL